MKLGGGVLADHPKDPGFYPLSPHKKDMCQPGGGGGDDGGVKHL